MTRESKLALIVGFGLILFVGILVSDHFSAGQRQEAAHLLAQRGALRNGAGPISIQAVEGGAADTRNVARNAPPPPQEHTVTGDPGIDARSPVPPTAPPADADEIVVRHEIGARNEEPPPTTDTPGDELYAVKDGETMYSICSAHYRDASLWQALAEYNKSAVPNPARMRSGVTLRLPPIEVLKPGRAGRASTSVMPPASPDRGARAEQAAKAPESERAGRGGAATYTVKRGETLTFIAQKILGSSSRWKELAKLNVDVVPDPDALVPGTILRLPVSS